MKRKRYSVETIMRILRQTETEQSVAEVCREYEITEQTLYRWRRKYDNMDLSDAKRLKALEAENRRLKSIVADQALNIVVLKEVNSKKW
ncbi:MAG: putative transposase [Lentimonas sp.]|jgi:putative transposase